MAAVPSITRQQMTGARERAIGRTFCACKVAAGYFYFHSFFGSFASEGGSCGEREERALFYRGRFLQWLVGWVMLKNYTV